MLAYGVHKCAVFHGFTQCAKHKWGGPLSQLLHLGRIPPILIMVIQWLYNGYRMLYNCYIIVISWLLHVIIIMDQYTYIHIYTCTISEATVRPHSCLFKHRLIWHEGSLEVISAGVEHVREILPSGYLT